MAFQAKKPWRQVCYIETGDQESIEKFPGEAQMDRNNDNFNQREHHALIWTKRKVHVFDAKLYSSVRSRTFSCLDLWTSSYQNSQTCL